MQNTSTPNLQQKTAKIFYGWWVILISTIGNTVNFGAIIVFTFGLFILPLQEEFGWSRTEIILAYSFSALLYAPVQPLVGKLIDRFSARKVILPSVVFLGLLLMSMYFLTPNLWHFYLIYIAMGLLGAGTAPPAYIKVISHWFDRKRGLALGLAMSGFGLGASLLPYLTHSLITQFGWRGAYVALGVIIIVVTVSVIGPFLRETPEQMGLLPDGDTVPAHRAQGQKKEKQGMSFAEVWRTNTFWLMVATFVFVSLGVHGVTLHLVPIIVDRGIDAGTAALAASMLGVAVIFARIGTGYLLDLINPAFIGACIFAVSAVGLLLLYLGPDSNYLLYPAVLLIGVTLGAETDLIAYMCGRYFGLLHIGEIYAYFFAIYIFGAVVGPLLMGAVFDSYGSYQIALATITFFMLVASVLMTRLGFVRRLERSAD